MKALFLAGGLGSRLKEMTKEIPKPMLPILEQPLLSRTIEKLKTYDINEIVVSICYLPQKIKEYFGDGKRYAIKISYQKENKPLGTGGAIKAAEKFFSETFFVFNADIVSDIDLKAMLCFHQKKKAAVTIAATHVKNPANYGVIEYDKNGYITEFKEKPRPGETQSHLINAGIYIFEPKVFEEIKMGVYSSVEQDIYPLLLQKKYKLAVYDHCAYWRDLGTPQDYLIFHQDILNNKVNFFIQNFSGENIFVGQNTCIGDKVQLIAPVYIGAGVIIEPYSVIGPYTVLGKNTVVGKGASLKNCVTWSNVKIDNYAKIDGAVMTPGCIISSNKNSPYEKILDKKIQNFV
ncbi:sugar phosphate nucleotidyltransferase [Pectinatus haikarae]|uniref:Mannose-1-phosphate guanylyltransferase n=1 Tax=Pectinatus haikarae TaxID=349096 RepID=A0ABT9Y5L9_9FIRM|nr:NDP-sugar synthase [Pectinatus haikarae]MDQ0203136.1 mannose-1-phosphate guanylyltransferase [Pectinatus haikarae]